MTARLLLLMRALYELAWLHEKTREPCLVNGWQFSLCTLYGYEVERDAFVGPLEGPAVYTHDVCVLPAVFGFCEMHCISLGRLLCLR